MWCGYAVAAIKEFVTFLSNQLAGSVRTTAFLDHHEETERRLYLGALALLATDIELDFAGYSDQMRRLKLATKWLHARYAAAPGEWVRQLSRTTSGPASPVRDLDGLTIEAIEAQIDSLRARARRMDSRQRKSLQKVRESVAIKYGSIELRHLLLSVMSFPMEPELTFCA